ncbi:peptidase inhibitor family I36 protein [Streptomyces niveus]|uniref:peptidase inhibitor family I36 protein n=1 Tax=Streptomyces niveus TaxID=193462 RepID=UPI0036492B3D
MIKKLALALPLALTAALAPAAASSAAPAAPFEEIQGHGLDACPAGSLCLYEHTNYNGTTDSTIVVVTGTINDLHNYGFGDRASSAYFNEEPAADRFYLHTDTNGKGEHMRFFPGKKLPNFHKVSGYTENGEATHVWMNDDVSSVTIR